MFTKGEKFSIRHSLRVACKIPESVKRERIIEMLSQKLLRWLITMAKQKFRPTRLGGFSGAKAYIEYVEILKKRRNAVGRTFCDAINRGA
jgi:hypothetical protein